MVKIGITGGIGSGKSTVSKVWQSHGAYVINADDLAKDIMVENGAVIEEIIATFGNNSYHPDGELNRSYLAEQAFGKGRVKELNAIVHPRIPEEVDALMKRAENEGYEAVVYEAALLFENLGSDRLDYIVLVLAAQKRRVEWVKIRDQSDEESITDRMEKQQDFSTLIHKADRVIRNEGTLDELKRKAQKIYKELIRISGN
jgi:dephospho-CoA kinase